MQCEGHLTEHVVVVGTPRWGLAKQQGELTPIMKGLQG